MNRCVYRHHFVDFIDFGVCYCYTTFGPIKQKMIEKIEKREVLSLKHNLNLISKANVDLETMTKEDWAQE